MLLAWPLVENTACIPEQLENAQPGLSEVILVVLTVAQSTLSLKLMVTLLSRSTPVAVSVGTVEVTESAIVSTVTVIPALPAPPPSSLADVSVARLLMV